jgi:hypothetical protein
MVIAIAKLGMVPAENPAIAGRSQIGVLWTCFVGGHLALRA